MSTSPALSVAIKFYIETDTPDTFEQVPGLSAPGAVGDKGAFKDATPVDADGYSYIAAVPEGEDKEITFFYYPGNAAQESLRADADGRVTKKVKMEFTELDKSATFEMVFSGWAMPEPEFNEAAKFVVYAKKNTSFKTVWSAIA